MNIIEEIEISKFRSIGVNEKFKAKKLNIFSGSNDSGKSNYLKALNLFFNNQTDINSKYNAELDFNKWFRDNNIRGQRNISIKIKFSKGNYQDKEGINKGFYAEKIYRIDGGFDSNFYLKDGKKIAQDTLSHRKASSLINEKIKFIYIPTIRDLEFRKNIQRQIEEIANSTDKRFKSQDLKDAFEKMETGVNNQLHQLTTAIKDSMKINIQTNVNFSTLLESLTFDTNDKIIIKKRGKKTETQSVVLTNRGDGIQMQFFSFLLWFISKNDAKHKYIWGYEEPEIAFEFKRQFELFDLFKNEFTKVAQIFLTTHSPAFALTEPNENINVFRVSYEKDTTIKAERLISKLKDINDYYNHLFEELENSENKLSLERDIWGINAQKISKMIGDSFNEVIGIRHISNHEINKIKESLISYKTEKEKIEGEVNKIKSELNNIYPDNVFICEDANSVKLWESLLIRSGLITCENFKILTSKGCTNNDVEVALLHLMKGKPEYKPKIYRQLDRDGFTAEQINMLIIAKESNSKFKKFSGYKVAFLNVNEIENYAILANDFFTEELLKSDFEKWDNLADAFQATATSNINAAQKLFTTEEDKKKFRNCEKIMKNEAKLKPLKYFPGKEIAKLKNRFKAEKYLVELPKENYPIELIEYLDEIKNFFN